MIKAEKEGLNPDEIEVYLEVNLTFLDESLNPEDSKTMFRFEMDAEDFEQLHQALLQECIKKGHFNFKKQLN